jgi:hypothetical protein
LWTSYLSYDVCSVSENMCVDCACMSKWKQWEIDLTYQWGQTQRRRWLTIFRLICSPPPRSRFTAAKSALKLVMGVICSPVTDFIACYQYRVISNGLKQPVIDRALISNGLYELVTDRFNLCNKLYLTFVAKNSCNGRLRRPLLEVYIGNGRCGGQPWGRPVAFICNGRQITTVTDVGACNGC